MKLKVRSILHVVWLAYALIPQMESKVVGNIKDDDGGTLTIVNIEDDNKTQYYNQNSEVGNYNYGYDVKPNGPVGQFHHENKSPQEVVYGCYGYEGPDTKNHMTFYVSDAWGYRPVRYGQDLEIFYPADNPAGTGHMNGQMVKWQDLVFPEKCADIGDRIASSSNLVTNQPIQPAFSTGLPSTAAPSQLAVFTGKASTVPQGSFDVIQVNVPSTIGPQPGRLSTIGGFTGGVTPTSQFPQQPASNSVVPGRTVSSPVGTTRGPNSAIRTTGFPVAGSEFSGLPVGGSTRNPTGAPSSSSTSGVPTSFGSSAGTPSTTFNGAPNSFASSAGTPSTPFTAVPSTGIPVTGTTSSAFSRLPSTGAPSQSFATGPGSTTRFGQSAAPTTSSRFTSPAGVTSVGTTRGPAFSGGIVSTGAPSSSAQPNEVEDEVDSQSSNNGPLVPNRPNRPSSTSGPGTTQAAGFSRNSSPFLPNTQFSRLVPTPTEPALGSTNESGNPSEGLPSSPSSLSNGPQTTRFGPTRPPTTQTFNFRTTTTSAPAAGTTFQVPSGPSSSRATVPAAPKAPLYGNPDDDDGISPSNVSANPVGSTASTRGPSRAPVSTGSGRIPTNGFSTGSPSGTPTGSSPFTASPSIPTAPGSSRGTNQPTTGFSTSNPYSPTATTANVPTSSGSRPSSGFSGNFNNPSTLQPSSSNQQTVPGGFTSSAPSRAPTTFGPTGTSSAPGSTNPTGIPSGPTGFSSTGTTPGRFSSTSRQPVPTSRLPIQSTGAPSTSLPSSPSSRGTPSFSTPGRTPTSSTFPSSTSPQFSTRPASPTFPTRNVSSPSDNDFCSTQCSSCPSSNAPPSPPPTHSQPPSDEDFLRIPGALMSQVPVIFYPDCNANAYVRPAVVPFCPAQQTQCGNGQQPFLSMRFPDTSNFLVTPGGPVARNAFVADQAAAASVRVARKVRRGPRQQQRLVSP